MTTKCCLYTLVILLILMFLAVFGITSSVDAQTVHALLIILGNDRDIRNSVDVNDSNMQTLLRLLSENCEVHMTVMKSADETTGIVTEKTLANADVIAQNSPQQLGIIKANQVTAWIRNLQPNSADTILIYYSGHGRINEDDVHILNFDPNVSNDSVTRDGLRKRLMQKQGRLKMLITDTCSNQSQRFDLVAKSYGRVVPRKRRYTEDLFLKHKGFLNITAASPGQYAWGNNQIGGYFTAALIQSFTSSSDVDKDAFLSWKEVFFATRDETQRLFSETTFRTIDQRKMKDIGQTTQTPTKTDPLPARLIQTETFDVLSPTAHIAKVWVDHNKLKNNVKGMLIYVKFEVDNFKGRQGFVRAYFYKKNEDPLKNGAPLKDTNNKYRTMTGNVGLSRNFRPAYVNAIYKDYTLFLPYNELHLHAGKHSLEFHVQIFNQSGKALSAKSNWLSFTLTNIEQ